MNMQQMKKLVVSGALLAGASTFSLPALSQQAGGPCGASGGGSAMGMGQMPMMGGGHMGMMGGGHMGMMGGGHMGMMGGGHMGMMMGFEKLGLTDEQREQIGEIKHKLHKQHWSIMGQMIDVKEELRKAHSGDMPDPKAVGAVYGKMFDLQRQMIEARMEAKNLAFDLLTEEQVAQMKSMKQARRGMMQGHGGKMQGKGGMMQGQGAQAN